MIARTLNQYFAVVRLAAVFIILDLKGSVSHVGLTYPPARNFDLDFLDNIRTKPPCGMPKGNIGTTIVAGSILNVTWHLSYPHRGGYRLELLDREEKFILDLKTGKNTSDYVNGDPTAQWHTITVPADLTCEDCTIRLLRQASEWANSYRFWSCADVRIVRKDKYKEDCLGHGTYSGTTGCKCDEGYWGPRCQYKDECTSDTDCGTGKCIDLGGTSLPRKQCFCPYGYHGEKCDKINKDKLPNQKNLNLPSYTMEKFSDKMSMYYKMIPAAETKDKEIEFVLVVNGTSYGALGWRPASLNKTCKMWPYVDDDKERKRKVRQTSKGKMYIPNPTLLRPLSSLERSIAEPEPSMRQKSHVNDKHKNKLEHTKVNEVAPSKGQKPIFSVPESEPKPEVEPESEPEGIAESKPEPEKSAPEPESENSVAETEPEPEKAAPESEPKSKPESEPENVVPESEPKSEPESEPEVAAESEPTKRQKSWLKGPPESEPESEPEKHHDRSSEPEPESEPEKHQDGSAEPEHHSEPEPGKHHGKSAQPEPEHNAEPESEPEKHQDVFPEPEHHAEPEPGKHHGKSTQPEPEHDAEPEKNHDSSAEPESEPENHAEPESEPEKQHDSSSEPESEPESSKSQIKSVYSKERKRSAYSPKGDFHAMDCVDIVMGAARGELSRIRDYYTRDRSTPRLDTFWGGTDDLTSVTGWEADGTTFLIFRRKISSLENTDHSITGEMHVIWARGQQQGKYVHSPKSGIEAESPSVPNFYSEDEIKYHGHRSQRGVTYVDFSG